MIFTSYNYIANLEKVKKQKNLISSRKNQLIHKVNNRYSLLFRLFLNKIKIEKTVAPVKNNAPKKQGVKNGLETLPKAQAEHCCFANQFINSYAKLPHANTVPKTNTTN